MQKIILATSNPGKITEFRDMLSGLYNVVFQQDMSVSEVAENGQSFIENALIKAKNASKQAKLPAIADDSGIVIDALNGEPGIYSARYAGVGSSDDDNIKKVLNKMQNVAPGKRNAYFCCAIVFVNSANNGYQDIIVKRIWKGEILKEKVGNNGFGYDPIFYLPIMKLTAAQLSLADKNKLSHRGKALRALLKKLKKLN